MRTQVAAIEFGTSKIVTVIAENGGFNRCDIIGSGTVPYDGYQGGDWVTPNRLAQAVYNSISAAEKDAGTKIKDIYIGVPCEYIHVKHTEATVPIRGERGRVSEEDIDEVQDMAANVFRFDRHGGNVIHRSPAWFSIDNGKRTMMPLNVRGQNLTACVSFIVADQVFLDDMRSLMDSMGLGINGFLSSSFGEQLLLTSIEDREKPCIFANVGFLNTEVSVCEGDAMVYHAVLPMGGAHLTEDLAQAMEIRGDEAEQLKRCFVLGADRFDLVNPPEFYDESGRRLDYKAEFVKECMKTGVDELCGMIQMTIEDAGDAVLPRSQVYLTGGGLALIRGGREYLAGKLKRPVKVPAIKAAKLNSPVYSSVMGLVDLIFDSIEQRSPEQDTLPNRLADGLRGLFNRR